MTVAAQISDAENPPLRARTVGAPPPAALESLATFLLGRLEAEKARRPKLVLVKED